MGPDAARRPVPAPPGRRPWGWFALLALTPVCLGGVAWAALGLNGSYPTVKPPVPAGWKAVNGIYASISVPRGWALRTLLSDDNGDSYFSGRGGGVGLSVAESKGVPAHTGTLPAIVGTFLDNSYRVQSVTPTKLANAAAAWRFRFELPGHQTGAAVLAWARATQSEVWLVATELTPTTARVFATLTLAR